MNTVGEATSDVDRHIGLAIRANREAAGLGVDAFADALALTAQEVARYEAGEARVSASRLFAISAALGAPVSTFYAGLLEGNDGADLRDSAPMVEIVRLMSTLSHERQQMVLDVARSTARAQIR